LKTLNTLIVTTALTFAGNLFAEVYPNLIKHSALIWPSTAQKLQWRKIFFPSETVEKSAIGVNDMIENLFDDHTNLLINGTEHFDEKKAIKRR
jgi:hypothetical protein